MDGLGAQRASWEEQVKYKETPMKAIKKQQPEEPTTSPRQGDVTSLSLAALQADRKSVV